MTRMRRWLIVVTIAVGSVLVVGPEVAAADAGLTASTDSVAITQGDSKTVTVVNLAPTAQTVRPVPDGPLDGVLDVAASTCTGTCPPLPSGQPRTYTLTAAKAAKPVSGTLLFVGTARPGAAATSVAVKVSVSPAAAPSSAAAQPDTVTIRTTHGHACAHVTLAAGAGFAGAHGQLDGPHHQATFALVTEKAAGTACRNGSIRRKLLAAPPAGGDGGEASYVLLADGLRDAGTYTAPVALDPADAKTTVKIQIQRTYQVITAVWWALFGAGLAVLLGVLAAVWRHAKKVSDAAAAVAEAQDDQDRAQAALRARRRWFGALYGAARDEWTVVGDKARPINDTLSADDARKAADALGAETDALLNLLSGLAATGPSDPLTTAVVAAVTNGPELGKAAGQGAVAKTEQLAKPWFDVLSLIDAVDRSTVSADAGKTLDELRGEALRLSRPGRLDGDGVAAALDDLRRRVVAVAGAQPELPHRAPGAVTLGVEMMRDAIVRTVGAPSRLRLPPSRRAQVRRHAALSKTLFVAVEFGVGAVALAVGLALAISDKYYGQDTWGGIGDYLKTALWAVTASGGVQVAKLLTIGSLPITTPTE